MINILFLSGLAALLFATLIWGIKTLPSERWQMIAAVAVAKTMDGAWQGINFTFYGFFSATAEHIRRYPDDCAVVVGGHATHRSGGSDCRRNDDLRAGVESCCESG